MNYSLSTDAFLSCMSNAHALVASHILNFPQDGSDASLDDILLSAQSLAFTQGCRQAKASVKFFARHFIAEFSKFHHFCTPQLVYLLDAVTSHSVEQTPKTTATLVDACVKLNERIKNERQRKSSFPLHTI